MTNLHCNVANFCKSFDNATSCALLARAWRGVAWRCQSIAKYRLTRQDRTQVGVLRDWHVCSECLLDGGSETSAVDEAG